MNAQDAMRRRIDLKELGASKAYFFMISAVVPRPIAWVSSRGADGTDNLAPFSFFQGVCPDPPTLMLSISQSKRSGETKDTLRNVRETGGFVVNVVPEPMGKAMVSSSEELSYETSEIERAGLATFPAETVDALCLADSPVNMECRLSREIEIGRCSVVFGEIQLVHAHEAILDERDVVDPDKLRPWSRLGGSLYMPYGGATRLK